MKLVPTKKLKLHPQARRIPRMTAEQQREFRADIRERGIRVPIEIIAKNVIVDGRSRWLAAKRLGISWVPVVNAPLNGDDPVLYMLRAATKRRHLTDDQRACLAQEEMEYLARVSRQVRARAGGTAGGRGRRNTNASSAITPAAELSRDRSKDVRALAADRYGVSERKIRTAQQLKARAPQLFKRVLAGHDRLAVAKRAAERDSKRREQKKNARLAKRLGSDRLWEIRCGDCVDEMQKLKPGTVRLIFADPPYNQGVDYGDGAKADRLPDAKYLAWCGDWIRACVRLLSDDGSLWVMIADEYADHFGMILRQAGLPRRAWIKWYETFGVNCANNFNRCSRHIFYHVKTSKQFVFNADAVNRPSARQAKYRDKRAVPGGKLWDNVWIIPRLVESSKERLPDFPTQLPLALIRPIVLCASNPGDVVLDPFSGSGTTGFAAVEAKRRYIGIERNPRFARLSRDRLRTVPS